MNALGLRVFVLAGLVAFLIWKHWQRRKQYLAAKAALRVVTGHGFDAAQITPHLAMVRQNHAAVRLPHQQKTNAHQEFALKMQTSLRRLAFFTDRTPREQPDQTALSEPHSI